MKIQIEKETADSDGNVGVLTTIEQIEITDLAAELFVIEPNCSGVVEELTCTVVDISGAVGDLIDVLCQNGILTPGQVKAILQVVEPGDEYP